MVITGPNKSVIAVTEMQRHLLEQLVRRHRTPQPAKRARVILESMDGLSNNTISRRIPLERPQVGVWRERWVSAYDRLCLIETEQPEKLEEAILEVLADAPRPGAPATFTPEQIVHIVAIACEANEESERPVNHWTPREVRNEAVKRGIVNTIS
ncbi:helix-turn-helix domain-containing protein [Paenibacillus prosopidis]|uniref:Homeodomain-containing protein n=1 Tax=Paenibacillus prosopidis TaxID=630520 RepID=A0A368WAE8_9BACL|nr:helix-turn-helix domain-containing protein [Paenibacillus prosopidis]RCW50850.1 hypothetical protein DFP97_10242 [Paenibacillus prosopidis]